MSDYTLYAQCGALFDYEGASPYLSIGFFHPAAAFGRVLVMLVAGLALCNGESKNYTWLIMNEFVEYFRKY
jgi:uncharacterized membrane protein YphA (DoxX/SURF4 family)